jgi:N-acetyl sugar amidotransferase
MTTNDTGMYGLPTRVVFCSRCVMSNQRPASVPEYRHTLDARKPTLRIDEDGVCDACRHAEIKQRIDWAGREAALVELLARHRRQDGLYDCVVPGSGGKDSAFAAHVLKYKYGMHPLTVTWPPMLYTDYGYQNYLSWLQVGGFDNITMRPNGRVMKTLTRLSIENLLHPFQTFILGQKSIAAKIAADVGVPLVFYGENEAEYGNPIADSETSLRDRAFHALDDPEGTYLAGVSLAELLSEHALELVDLKPFLPAEAERVDRSGIEVHYLGYYLKWTPQEVYYYAVENTGFKARPYRTQGTYSKYNSIDDKIDDLHYYTTYAKFGIGRATYDSSQEIRNGHLTREEGLALVKRFDGEFPDRYFDEVMTFLEIDPTAFHHLVDRFRPPHLWAQVDGTWRLRHTANRAGVDD